LSSEARSAIAILVAFVLARVVFALTLGLGVDEAYTLVVSRPLQLSYFDHPPLHQWIAHYSAIVLGEGPLARLPFVALFALSGWLLFVLTRRLYGASAGLIALVALNATPFFFASAGSWIVPDGVLVCALLGAAIFTIKVALGDEGAAPGGEQAPLSDWLLLGLCFGLAGLSKYSALLSALGAAAFLLTQPRSRAAFATPKPYLAALVALAVVAPVLLWNAENHWVSFAFQGGRSAPSGKLHIDRVLAMAAGQFAYLTPWIGVGLIGAVVAKARGGLSAADRLCLALALPAIVVFTLVPLWGARGLPHWPMPGWLFLYPMLGGWLSGAWPGPRRLRVWGVATAAVTLALAVVVVAQADWGFATPWLGARAAASDVTLETLGWGALSQALPAGVPPAFAASVKWLDAGKIGVALGPDVPVLVYSDDPRGFAFLPGREALIGKDGVLIVRAGQESAARQALSGSFAGLGEGRPVSIDRAGVAVIPLVVIPAMGLRALPTP
jgi:4-amino-4-deoxy-L-arabinose transferase-like glycosyltransferase